MHRKIDLNQFSQVLGPASLSVHNTPCKYPLNTPHLGSQGQSGGGNLEKNLSGFIGNRSYDIKNNRASNTNWDHCVLGIMLTILCKGHWLASPHNNPLKEVLTYVHFVGEKIEV